MPLRFRLPDDAAGRVAFSSSPLLEAIVSLHVLVSPKHHPLQHPWVRRMRALDPALKRSIRAFSFAYWRFMPDFVAPSPTLDYLTFEEEIEALLALDPEQLALEFLRPMWDHEGKRDPAILRRPRVRAHAITLAGRWGADADLVQLVFDDPAELTRRFAALLRGYWEAAFAGEWERVEPRLADAIAEAGRRIAAGGVYSVLGELAGKIVVDRERGEFGLNIPHHHTVEVTEENPLVLVPSAFVWPHVYVNCDAPWPLHVVYPAPFVAQDARPKLPSEELVGLLRALGDDVRLRALRLIAERPRSTQELAPLVGISEAGVSKQLRALANAGLVSTRRDGYYVLYSLVPDRIAPLSDALLDFLGQPERELA
jgi:DNA-binding transcriptional ArsR family regulator